MILLFTVLLQLHVVFSDKSIFTSRSIYGYWANCRGIASTISSRSWSIWYGTYWSQTERWSGFHWISITTSHL